ncbi:MAG: nitroreductase family protein [Mycoplasmataceae bacterium]|nr:nitroreductase family protein [Mycoplasmataceae bacterium]
MNKVHNNETIDVLLKRRSIRKFDSEWKIKKEDIELIKTVFKNSPTWINGQSVSMIIVTDKKIKDEISILCGGQKHINEASAFIVFIADYNKMIKTWETNNLEYKLKGNFESTLINVSMHDSGIALANISTALGSIGYGTVPVGGVRNNMEKLTKLLNLPKHSFPTIGLSVGKNLVESSTVQKPLRFPNNVDIFIDKYNEKQFNSNDLKKFDIDYEKVKGFKYSNSTHNYWQDKCTVADEVKFYKEVGLYKK